MSGPASDPPPAAVQRWLDGTRDGDPAAAEALVNYLYPVVIQVARRRRPERMDETDAAQEVFLRLFRKLEQFRGGPESLIHWTRRLAFTTCLNLLRHERRRPELHWDDLPPAEAGALEALAAPEGDAGAAGDRRAARELLERLLATLPAEDRWLIEWLELEELSVAEVAERTGWSAVRVRVRAHRARRKLKRAVKLLWHERKPNR
jgi:RNA polymerase sigma-70 factor (ECF subfamily)